MFGIALAKNSSSAKPLAESVTSTGYTYTWFGGLWCSNPWGAYSANFAVSIVELQMRLWVTYPWGMPIIAENIKQQPDTYDTNGPFHITCTLTDDGAGFTPQDFAELVYEVNHTNQQRIQLADESGGIYGADIVINGSIDDDIVYWIHTIDETGLEYESAAKSFTILSPENPFTDVLLVFDNLGAEREYPYISFLEENDYVPEIWDADEHKGIDASVILNGWNTMIVIGDGSGLIPAYSGGDSPFAQFLDIGGALLYIDQDYFAGNNLPQFGGFNPGDFAHDYLGISGFANDPWYPNLPPDTVYYGVTNNPVSGSFALSPYALYCLQNGMEQDEIKPDCFTPGNGTACFQGGYYGSYQGILYDNGFKTVYLAFPAEAGCEIDVNPLSYTYGMWLPTMQFDTLLSNISACFNVLEVDKTVNAMIHVEYALHQNYPNPFNPTTTIKYELPEMSEIKLTIYNIQGQEVLVLQEGLKQAGYHKIVWNGISADGVPVTSGLYFCKFTAKGQISGKNYNRISKMLLIK
ncbi:T9SS type A sorting domain-containing protein [bacterium]|nr:T9SS type A sorting domain-containing protein [FCB group bacterium]MBL7190232.1 T9SS type A sorting domain-containing protein [bacterium]